MVEIGLNAQKLEASEVLYENIRAVYSAVLVDKAQRPALFETVLLFVSGHVCLDISFHRFQSLCRPCSSEG